MNNPRLRLWHNICEDLGPPEGCVIPWWLVVCRFVIFPLSTACIILRERLEPYDIWTLTWTIYGVKYSDAFFRHIAIADGELISISRIDGRITVTRYKP
jgi:hypothetical protein